MADNTRRTLPRPTAAHATGFTDGSAVGSSGSGSGTGPGLWLGGGAGAAGGALTGAAELDAALVRVPEVGAERQPSTSNGQQTPTATRAP